MILDAVVPVSCDDCYNEVNVELEYVYHSYSGKSGQYDTSDGKIEKTLEHDHEWLVIHDNHYCEECKNKYEEDD